MRNGLARMLRRALALALAAGLVGAVPPPAAADPPPWAPAWGWRAKHAHKHLKHYYKGLYYPYPLHYYDPYPDLAYGIPFGINLGRCNRALIGSLIGGAAGGLAGSAIGDGRGRTAAIVGGTLIGMIVGGSIGRSMDRADYACFGQALEYAPDHRPVLWSRPDGARYEVTPRGSFERAGRYCREYTTTAVIGGRAEQVYGTACRQPDGSWQLVS